MARVKNNKLMEGLSGQLNKQVVLKTYGNKTFVTRYPDMTKVNSSAKQKDERSLFGEAVLYAREIINDPEKKAAFQSTLETGRKVFNAAISAYITDHKKNNISNKGTKNEE